MLFCTLILQLLPVKCAFGQDRLCLRNQYLKFLHTQPLNRLIGSLNLTSKGHNLPLLLVILGNPVSLLASVGVSLLLFFSPAKSVLFEVCAVTLAITVQTHHCQSVGLSPSAANSNWGNTNKRPEKHCPDTAHFVAALTQKSVWLLWWFILDLG